MTATEQSPAEMVIAEAIDLAKGGSFNVAQLAKLLAGPAKPAQVTPAKPGETNRLPDGVRAAIENLPKIFNSVSMTEPRSLTGEERVAATEEAVAIVQVIDTLGKRLEQLKGYVAADITANAPEGSPVMTSGKYAGHALLATQGAPFNVQVPGYEDPWQQQRQGGKATPSLGKAKAARDAGLITPAEFRAITAPPAETRVLSDEALKRLLVRRPERGVEILRLITEVGEPTGKIVSPKK
jgi:hypothetical protein